MQSYCRELAEKQMQQSSGKGIWAVSRGGLVPGAILARELGIRHVDTICISSYDHDHQRDMTVVKAPEGDGEGFLIVEDLVDSGDTARKLREMYPKAKLIAVCAKQLVLNCWMTTLSILLKIHGLNSHGICLSNT